MELLQKNKIPRSVSIWLLTGIFMIFFQVVLGGITRLTDSGLSITEWELVLGILPPLNVEQWEIAFKKYQEHTLQFKAIHADMTLSEFKFIYFWEWLHRLWARSMGFVFIIPFLIFWRKKYLPAQLMRDLGIVVLFAALAAVFGWIMVQSGLNTEQFVWVNAYKLTIHLSIAITTLSFLWWATLRVIQPLTEFSHNRKVRKTAWRITIIICLQLVFGGLMSGMKAGLVAPHFPHMSVDQNGNWIWISEILFKAEEWNTNNLFNYNTNSFAPSLIQVFHRGTAYLLCILIPILFLQIRKLKGNRNLNLSNNLLLLCLVIQIALGIYTVINSLNPSIFPTLGVLHQAGGMLLLMAMLFVNYQFSRGGYQQAK